MRFAHTGAATPGTTLDDDVVTAARIGAAGLEVWAPKLAAALERSGLAGLREALRRHRVAAVSIAPIPDVLFRDPAGSEQTVAQVHRLAEVARGLGAIWLVATPGERPDGADERDVLHEALAALSRLAEISQRYDIGLALVPDSHPRAAVRTLAMALLVLESARRPALGLAPDTFHLYAAGSAPDEIVRCPPQALALLRLADAPGDVEPGSLREAHRLPPGDGVAPIAKLIALCRHLGADPPVVVPVPRAASDNDPTAWARRLRERSLALEPAPQPRLA